jgi:hypothetical protein
MSLVSAIEQWSLWSGGVSSELEGLIANDSCEYPG